MFTREKAEAVLLQYCCNIALKIECRDVYSTAESGSDRMISTINPAFYHIPLYPLSRAKRVRVQYRLKMPTWPCCSLWLRMKIFGDTRVSLAIFGYLWPHAGTFGDTQSSAGVRFLTFASNLSIIIV